LPLQSSSSPLNSHFLIFSANYESTSPKSMYPGTPGRLTPHVNVSCASHLMWANQASDSHPTPNRSHPPPPPHTHTQAANLGISKDCSSLSLVLYIGSITMSCQLFFRTKSAKETQLPSANPSLYQIFDWLLSQQSIHLLHRGSGVG
jgi:hypothetical protein